MYGRLRDEHLLCLQTCSGQTRTVPYFSFLCHSSSCEAVEYICRSRGLFFCSNASHTMHHHEDFRS